MQIRSMALFLGMIGCATQGATLAPTEAAQAGQAGPSGPDHCTALVPPIVPPELAVPEGNELTFMAAGRGVQIYECAADASGAVAWQLHAPRADLFDDCGAVIARHFGGVDKGLPAGPYWEANDGSRVLGGNPVSVPNAGSIPLLRLEAVDTSGTGVFSNVTFIQRLDTTGGVAPAGACEAGTRIEVPYTATYCLYSKHFCSKP